MDDTVIGVSGLVKNYPNVPAVCDVSFRVRREEDGLSSGLEAFYPVPHVPPARRST